MQKGTQKSIPFKTTNYACGIYIEQVLIICVHFSSRDLFLSRVVRCYFQKGQSFFNLVFSIVTLIIKQTNRITSKCLFRPMHCYIIDVLLVMSSQHRFPWLMKNYSDITKALAIVGVEPTTFALLARRSNRLSYTALELSVWNLVTHAFLLLDNSVSFF